MGNFVAKTLFSNAMMQPQKMMADPIGTVADDVSKNPFGTLGSLAGSLMNPVSGLIAAGIGRGMDSYNQSVQADKDLQAMGVNATGPDGTDRTTSALKDFLHFGFLGGQDAEDQKEDILTTLQKKYGLDKQGNFIKPTEIVDDYDADDYFTPGSASVTPVTTTDLPDVRDATPSINARNTSSGDFYNSGIQGQNPMSISINPNAYDPRMDDPLGSYMGVENMTSDQYINSPQQALDIQTAQEYADDYSGQSGYDADGPGGDDWTGYDDFNY